MTERFPNCAAPLVFENDIEELVEFFGYGTSGTGFLLRWKSRVFFITAKHALSAGDHNRLRVPCSFASTELLELRQYGHPIPLDNEVDTDHVDVAIFSVAEDSLSSVRDENALEPAHLPEPDTRLLLEPGVVLVVRGFPRAAPLAGVDAENKKIVIQAITIDAVCSGPTSAAACYELQFAESCPIHDFDSMSGSPVFFLAPRRDGGFGWILVGMMLRAGGPERLGRFVSIEVIKRMLVHYADSTEVPRSAP